MPAQIARKINSRPNLIAESAMEARLGWQNLRHGYQPNSRAEVGINMKGVNGTSRLEALPPGGMCQYKVKLTSPAEVDAELIAWIKQAYEDA